MQTQFWRFIVREGRTKVLQGDHHAEIRHHLWRLKYTELNEIFAFMSLRSFAISLISIFIPIYLYNLGFGLRGVFSFYLWMFSVELIFELLTAILIKKIGPKHLIALSVPFLIVHFLLLLSYANFRWPIWTFALSGGITLALYWQSYHYDFSRAKHRKKTTSDVGKLYMVLAILGAIAPFIGGVLAEIYGPVIVILTVIVILLFAVFILFQTKDENFRKGKLTLRNIKISEIKYDLLAYGGAMIEAMAAAVIWPLFLFFVVGSYQGVGALTSLAVLMTLLVTYYVSKKSDEGKRVEFLRTGSFLNSAVGVAKVLATTVPRAFGISLFKSFAYSIQSAPLTSEYYLHADEKSRSEYIYLMESMNDLSKVVYFFVMIMTTYYLSEQGVLIAGLIIGGVGGLLVMLMPPAKCEICGHIDNKQLKLARRLS